MRLTVLLALSLCATSLHASESTVDYKAQALKLFRDTIAFRTEVGQGQVPLMAQYLAERLRTAGFAAEDIHVVPLGETASLIVRYRGKAGNLKPILALAHMDVVTAKPSDWQRDPFTLVEENGYFFGRGTQDIKSGVVSIVSAFLRLKSEAYVPDRDLIAVLTGDEEMKQETAIDLARNHRDLIDAEFALNSDAGGGVLDEKDNHALIYGLQVAEKTYASFELTIRNPGGHSSLPRADNAIYQLADALKKLQTFRFPVMTTDATREYFRITGQQTPGKLGKAMRTFAVNPMDRDADDVLNNSPAYVGMTRTTCIPTLLQAGHADNALPQSATVTINCRIFPGVGIQPVQTALQNIVGPKVEIKPPASALVSDSSPLRRDVVEIVTRTVHKLYPGVPIVPKQESGATDGAVFRQIGIPTYGTGQVFIKDSDDFAHGLNERISVKCFYDGLDFWYWLLKDFSTPDN